MTTRSAAALVLALFAAVTVAAVAASGVAAAARSPDAHALGVNRACNHDDTTASNAAGIVTAAQDYGGAHPWDQAPVKLDADVGAPDDGRTLRQLAEDEGERSAPRRPRRLLDATQPIRMHVDTSNLDADVAAGTVTATQAAFVRDTMVYSAVAYWSEALQVVPVSAALHASRGCRVFNSDGSCQQFASRATCGSEDVAAHPTIPSSWLAAESECPNGSSASGCTSLPGGDGVAGADFVVLVTARNAATCGGEDASTDDAGGIADAAWCQTDQWDRPVFARLNVCPAALSDVNSADGGSLSGSEHARLTTIAAHELAHALGFSARSLPLFRDPADGSPRTPRSTAAVAPLKVADEYLHSVPCSSGSVTVAVPATTTLQFFSERGLGGASVCTPFSTPGGCVAKVVTPAVRETARLLLGCATVQGAELENQVTSSCAPFGSHWEKRLFSSSLMAAILSAWPVTDPLTLAWFEDSGWYTVDYALTAPLRHGISYGFQQGCAFAEDECVSLSAGNTASVSVGSPPHFCDPLNAASTMCTADRTAVGFCSFSTYATAIPTAYQYLVGASGVTTSDGGAPRQADYCPVIEAFENKMCRDDGQTPSAFMGESMGLTSSCFASTLSREVGGRSTSLPTLAACYDITCVEGFAVQVGVQDAPASTAVCQSPLQSVSVGGYDGALQCVDPVQRCAAGTRVSPRWADDDAQGSIRFVTDLVSGSGDRLFSWDVVGDATLGGAVTVSAVREGSTGAASVEVRVAAATEGTDAILATATDPAVVSWAAYDVSPKRVTLSLTPAGTAALAARSSHQVVATLHTAVGASLATTGPTEVTVAVSDAGPQRLAPGGGDDDAAARPAAFTALVAEAVALLVLGLALWR